LNVAWDAQLSDCADLQFLRRIKGKRDRGDDQHSGGDGMGTSLNLGGAHGGMCAERAKLKPWAGGEPKI